MWYSNQTLRLKGSDKLVRLYNPKADSAFHWEGNNLIDEQGRVFKDDLNKYTHVEDWFGRPAGGLPKDGEHIDTSLKQYLVSDEEREKKKEEALKAWYNKTLESMSVSNRVRNWNCDGGECSLFREYFLEKIGAQPLLTKPNCLDKPWASEYVFTFGGKTWLVDTHDLVVISLNKEFISSLLKGE